MGKKRYGVEFTCTEDGEHCEAYDLEKSLKGIWVRNKHNEDMIERLLEENKRLKDERYKDEELANMREEYNKMQEEYRRGFTINNEEQKIINEFIRKHDEKHGSYAGAIGGRYIYQFVPTSIGEVGTIICGQCREEKTFRNLS